MSESRFSDEDDRRILELAVERGKLTVEHFATLVEKASGSTCDLAIQENLISAADVDILRPLVSPREFLPDYEFLDVIGEGAMGTVYKARQIRLKRLVALKMLKPSALANHTATARSQIEAQLGAKMQHPNIVAVHDYGVQQGRVYLAMEFVPGQSIEERLSEHGAFDHEQALRILQQIVAALSHAADNDIIHRDVKPANVLLTDSVPGLPLPADTPAVKVLDFGLAFESQSEDATRLTADGAALGTPSYVAPEQLMNSTVDVRADIYALGATLYHMVTGVQPFGDSNGFQALAAKMQGNEEWRNSIGAEVPAALQQLILDMTHHAVDDRIADYSQLTHRIDRILAGDDSATLGALRGKKTAGSSRRAFLILVATVVSVLSLLVIPWFGNENIVELPVEVVREHWLFQGFGTPRGVVRGTWRPTEAADGGKVLAGVGPNSLIRFRAPAATAEREYFHFHVGVDPLDHAIVDICFAFQPEGECQILRLHDGTATLGAGHTDTVDFQASTAEPLTLLQRGDGPAYHNVRIAHQPGGWFVHVSGVRIGAAAVSSEDLLEMSVRVSEGTAHFEDIRYIETQPVSTDQ